MVTVTTYLFIQEKAFSFYVDFTQDRKLKWILSYSLDVGSRDVPIRAHIWAPILDNAAAAAKSLQSCPTLCDPIDGSPLGSPVPGILQARTLEWVAISFSNAWKWKVKVKLLSCVRLLVTPWTAAYQAASSMGFSRQEYWSGVPLPSLLKVPRPLQNEASCQSYWHIYHLISFLFSQIASVKQMSRLWRCLYML